MNELNILVDEWAILQAGIDETIYRRFDLEGTNELLPGLALALKVELGELANENRCFKHWSTKEPSSQEVILEEFADNLAFTLSMGLITGYILENDIGNRLFMVDPPERPQTKSELTELFNDGFMILAAFEHTGYSFGGYLLLFQYILNLAAGLGLTLEQIDAAYREKTIKNHERQEAGY